MNISTQIAGPGLANSYLREGIPNMVARIFT
jgi:hypothetical protein